MRLSHIIDPTVIMDKKRYSVAEHTGKTIEMIRQRSGILLLGLTGGIASGKSTVAAMLEEMGFFTIDFDILARQVVEPGKPAWKKIVDYFGKNILLDDGNIDRKMLSEIVFKDKKKRRELEAFIYPSIADEFLLQVEEIASKEPGAVIQAEVPLLIEGNMQDLFHGIILVYVPREKQVERLMERDGIRRDEAEDILKAQIPIDEKVEHADFVVHNENSPKETEAQVKDLWRKIKELRRNNSR
jgi:dephospho-CoA kinase